MNALLHLHLVPPSDAYRETFVRALHAFQREGLPWWSGAALDTALTDFPAFVAGKLADASPTLDGQIPKTHLWAILDGEFVGRLSIFHWLDEWLRRNGGHIGYDTVPSCRGRGIASEMLHQSIPIARSLGLTEILLTCDDMNLASVRVIEKNGGVLREKKALNGGKRMKRYYAINLR